MSYQQALFNTTYGRLDAAAVLAGYTTILNVVVVSGSISNNIGAATIIYFSNTLDADIVISLDNGTTDGFFLHAGKSLTIDLSAGNMRFEGVIRIKRFSGAPAAGSIACSVVRTKV